MKCSICHGDIDKQRLPNGEVYWDKGHNAWPINEGQCCSDCNTLEVIPARLKQFGLIIEQNEVQNDTRPN